MILCRFVLEKASQLSLFTYPCPLSPDAPRIREPNLAEGKLKFSLAGWPRYPNDSFDESPHLPSDLQASVPRTLKGTARENKELSKLLFTPLQFQAPAVTLGIVQQRASPSGRTVWWSTVKDWLCTTCQKKTQTEGDFDKHPTPHQHHWRRLRDAWRGTYFPQPTSYHEGRWRTVASTSKSTIWWWLLLSEMFVRITVPFNLLSGPWGSRTPCQLPWGHQSLPQHRRSPAAHSPQPCLAMGPTTLGPLVGPQPIPALVHPQGSAWCLRLGLPPSPLVPWGFPLLPPPREQPPMQCSDMYFLKCVSNCL